MKGSKQKKSRQNTSDAYVTRSGRGWGWGLASLRKGKRDNKLIKGEGEIGGGGECMSRL